MRRISTQQRRSSTLEDKSLQTTNTQYEYDACKYFSGSYEGGGALVMARESLELWKFLGLNLKIDKMTERDGTAFILHLHGNCKSPHCQV